MMIAGLVVSSSGDGNLGLTLVVPQGAVYIWSEPRREAKGQVVCIWLECFGFWAFHTLGRKHGFWQMTQPALDSITKRVILFAGNYGSGKTEVSVNFTFQLARLEHERGGRVSIVDLDIVNPYFRCREAVAALEEAGVEVIVPRGEHFASELPIILPEVRGSILRSGGRVVLDVGGDDVGARVLSGFARDLPPERAEMLLVLNARRPFTDTVDGALRMVRDIEASSKVRVSGLVSNTHLMEGTTPAILREGVALAVEVGTALGIPLRFVAAMANVAKAVEDEVARGVAPALPAPVLSMERRMLPPWISPLRQGRDRFRQIGLD